MVEDSAEGEGHYFRGGAHSGEIWSPRGNWGGAHGEGHIGYKNGHSSSHRASQKVSRRSSDSKLRRASFEGITEYQRESMRIKENQRKSKKINENRRKSTKIKENRRKSWKINYSYSYNYKYNYYDNCSILGFGFFIGGVFGPLLFLVAG